MKSWKKVTIEECVDILGDGLHGTPKYTKDGEYAFINGNNFVDGKIFIKPDTKKVDFLEFEKYKKSLNDRTIFVSINGTLGRVATYNNEKIVLGKSACYFNVKNQINKDFIFYVVSSNKFKRYMEIHATGTTIKNFSLKQMRNYSFLLPDIETQNKIATILKTIDSKIENNNKINNNLENQAVSIYNKLCIDNNSLKYKRGILSDIADITMGQSPKGSSYNENGIGTIFFQGKAEFGDRFPQVRLYTTEPKKIACINDTLISVRAPVGELNIAHTDCCIGRGLAAIRSKSKQQSFIHYTMCHLKKELDIFNANGTVFGSINKNSLNNMPIIIPPDEIIEQFEKIISPIDSIIRNNYNENCILKYIKEFLLSKLISGELDISNINI